MSETDPRQIGPRILFVVNEAGEFVELRRVAVAAKRTGAEIHFLFAQASYVNLRRDRAFCRLNGFRDYFPGKRLTRTASGEEALRNAAELENGYVPWSLRLQRRPRRSALRPGLLAVAAALFIPFRLIDRITQGAKRFRERSTESRSKPFRYARQVYNTVKPDLVVFGQEFPGSVNTVLTKLASADRTPTLLIPFALGTTKEIVESLSDKPEYEVEYSVFNRLAAFLFPHWVNYYAGKRLIRLHGRSVLLLEAAGLAPDHPWLPNSSDVDRIAVESPEMFRYYRRMQFPEEQLTITGAAHDDLLTEKLRTKEATRARLARRLRVSAEKKLLVCAWPTDQFGSRFIPLEFGSYAQLCEAWARALHTVLRITEYEVLIRPHPVTDPAFLTNMLRPMRLHTRVTDADTLELVAISDIFVACVSSTLRWAIASGVPALNYDCYDYGYTDFDSSGGVITVKKYSEFENALVKMTEDREFYADLQKRQQAAAGDWGFHDGRSMERIVSLIDEMSAAPRVDRIPAR